MVACVCVRVCGRVWPCVRLQAVGGGLVELSKPDMVAGVRVKVKAALFGHALTSCTRTVHFTLAQPLMGCGDQPLLSNLTRDERAEQDPSGDELCVARLAGSAHTQRALTVHVMFRLPRAGAGILSIFGADAPSLRRYGMCRSSSDAVPYSPMVWMVCVATTGVESHLGERRRHGRCVQLCTSRSHARRCGSEDQRGCGHGSPA